MAFNAKNYKERDWSRYNRDGQLVKIARTFNSENLVANEYKTIDAVKVGGPSLFIEYIYDTSGNILAQNEEIKEWTQTQEDINTGASATEIAAGGDNVTAATQTTYATSTTDVQYWLGLEADGQLTKQHIGTATSVKQIFHYALPTTAVDGQCLQRIHHIDSSVITSKVDILGVWSQAMQDIAAPAISDITLSAAATVEDQLVGVNIGTLATTGSNPGHGTITWTLTSTTLSGDKLRIGTGADVDKLEVGPNAIGASDAGTYNAVIRGTDELGGYREETFSITITSNNITDIALSAATIPYGSNADTAIGTLSYTGGVGTLTPTITSDGGMNNLRLDGNVLESGPSWMNSPAGTYTVRITVTDQAPTPQAYYEDFTITVSSTAITDIALSATTVLDNAVAGVDIGNLTCTGGVGDVAYSITAAGGLDNIKVTDTGSSTAVFEVDTGGIVDSVASYSVTFLATDTRSQTYSETISISVTASYTDNKFLNFDTKGVVGSGTHYEYIDMGKKADWDNSDSFWFRRTQDDYTISWWMRLPESTAVYTDGGFNNDIFIFSSLSAAFSNGIAGFFRGSDFVFIITKDGSNLGWYEVESVT